MSTAKNMLESPEVGPSQPTPDRRHGQPRKVLTAAVAIHGPNMVRYANGNVWLLLYASWAGKGNSRSDSPEIAVRAELK